MLKPRQETPENMLRAGEDKLEKLVYKEDKDEAFTQAEMDYTEDGDIESDDDIGEGSERKLVKFQRCELQRQRLLPLQRPTRVRDLMPI